METQIPDPSHITPVAVSRRLSLWRRIGGGSLTTAIVFHVILLIVGAICVYKIVPPKSKAEIVLPRGGGDGRNSAMKAAKPSPIRPTDRVRRVGVTDLPSTVNIRPDLGTILGAPDQFKSMGGSSTGGVFGNGTGSPGMGGDKGLVPGFGGDSRVKMFMPLPQAMGKRCSREDRMQRIRETGGTPACEDAVVASLRWLKANQAPDGSWGGSNKVAMTGLALLAYFGHCESPASPEFGDSCLKGIAYLVNIGMHNEGRLASSYTSNHWPYEHAIATYALGEATTFCKDMKIDVPSLLDVTTKAGQFIIDNQHDNGGWAYLYAKSEGHTDVSVAGWQIQALKACSHTGIKFSRLNACINSGLKYLDGCRTDEGGYGYNGKAPAGGLTYCSLSGVGMLCNQMWGKGGMADLRKSAKYVLANTKLDYNSGNCDLYAHYYESQAMMRSGKDAWKTYNEMFRDQILNNQDNDGSWKIPGGGKKIEAVAPTWAAADQEGKIYRTCLCTLMLEVYYRFLNTDDGSSRNRQGI